MRISRPAIVAALAFAAGAVLAVLGALFFALLSGTESPSGTAPADHSGVEGFATLGAEATDTCFATPLAEHVAAMREEAEAGNPRAQYGLAMLYRSGCGLEPDLAQSAKWMEAAAESGLVVAMYNAGVAAENGNGRAKDLRAALEWYRRAAEGGNLHAMHNYAVFLIEGTALAARDPELARDWFEEAANAGLVDSQFNLAIIYESGPRYGLEQDIVRACFWYSVAARGGDREATVQAERLMSVLLEEERAQVEADLKAFRVRPSDPVANGEFDYSPRAFARD